MSAFTTFVSGMDRFFATPGRLEGSPAAKKRETDASAPDKVQVNVMKDGLVAALTAFSGVVEQRITAVEAEVTTQGETISNLQGQVSDLQTEMDGVKLYFSLFW